MMIRIHHVLLAWMTLLVCGVAAMGAANDDLAAYMEVAIGRATKIVDAIDLGENADKREAVIQAIAGQYRDLHVLQEARDLAVSAVREVLGEEHPDTLQSAVESVRAGIADEVMALHVRYVSKLSSLLPPEQVNAVKDGMTYGVAPNTYKVYMAMIPDLTEPQKARIHAWLIEAREYAMDGGSSEEKHRWFGKYKGKINNYLSSLGYDLKQAEQDMWARLEKEKKNAR